MRIIRDSENPSDDFRGATLVLGSFDGIHRGHAALIALARAHARPIGVLTFSPHPRLITQPEQPPFLLTPGKAKHAALRLLGVDFCVELSFTRHFASISAEDFVADVLVERLAAKHVIVGYDFRFGAGRQGNVALLHEIGEKYGFSVEHVAPVLDDSGRPYSSSRIRECLRAGDVSGAHHLLGRPWTIQAALLGELTDGERGAAFHFGEHLKPLPGHYSVRLFDEHGRPVDALLLVSQDDIGRLKFGQTIDLRRAEFITLEFHDFIAPLFTARPCGEVRDANVCYF